MCGRWRNGVPLALSPKRLALREGIPPEQLNNYEYVNADGSGEPEGTTLSRCVRHKRRMNPRGQPITGQGGNRAGAMILTGRSVVACHYGLTMIQRDPTTASSQGSLATS